MKEKIELSIPAYMLWGCMIVFVLHAAVSLIDARLRLDTDRDFRATARELRQEQAEIRAQLANRNN